MKVSEAAERIERREKLIEMARAKGIHVYKFEMVCMVDYYVTSISFRAPGRLADFGFRTNGAPTDRDFAFAVFGMGIVVGAKALSESDPSQAVANIINEIRELRAERVSISLGVQMYKKARKEAIEQFEREHMRKAFIECNGNVSRLATEQGLDRTYTHRLLRKHKILGSIGPAAVERMRLTELYPPAEAPQTAPSGDGE